MKYEVKFEWIFALLLLLSLDGIFLLVTDVDMKNIILLALSNAFSASVGFIFGKTQPDSKQ